MVFAALNAPRWRRGALTGLRKRGVSRESAAACLLVTLAAAVLLLSSDAFEFSWRYQLPAVVMLPLAGALGITALATRRARDSGSVRSRPSRCGARTG